MDPVSVIVVSYYKFHRLQTCIESILKDLTDQDELIVIENTPDNNDARQKIRRYLLDMQNKNGHRMWLQFNERNLMFSGSINMALDMAREEYIFLVNNDCAVLEEGTFRKLVEFSKTKPKLATLTPVTVNSKGKVYCSGAFGGGCHKRDRPNEPRKTEWNNFAFAMLKRSVLNEVGTLETGGVKLRDGRRVSCAHFHSDCEFGHRCADHGYEHWVHPMTVRHFYQEG